MTRVLTVGSFDLLHLGHVRLFKACKDIAGPDGILTIGVNSSDFIQTFKNPPVQETYERVDMVAACKYVDEVLINDSESLASMIEEVNPDFLVIGSDWAPPKDYYAQIGVDAQWLNDHGVTLLYLDRNTFHSSTELKERIRNG